MFLYKSLQALEGHSMHCCRLAKQQLASKALNITACIAVRLSHTAHKPLKAKACIAAGYFEAPGALMYGLGSVAGTLQPFNPQPVTIVFCNMDNLPLMKVQKPALSHTLAPCEAI